MGSVNGRSNQSRGATVLRYQLPTPFLLTAASAGTRIIPEIARKSVESKPPSELIDYATATPFANGFFETAFAIEDSSIGI
jgi:hypothetical protein